MEVVFDIETNGYLKQTTKVHCISLYVIGESYDVQSYTNAPYAQKSGTLEDGLAILSRASTLIGHNIQAFDIPALKKVFSWWKYVGKIRDTLIMSRLQHVHDMMEHSLEAWGKRLKIPKGDFGKQADWKEWSIAMQLYCNQDVRVNVAVWNFLKEENFSEESIELEHAFAYELDLMMAEGVPFDYNEAVKMADELERMERELHATITQDVPPLVKRTPFIPKVNNAKLGYIKGVPTFKVQTIPFNPNSRSQVVRYLMEGYGWKPTEFTDKGNPKITGEIIRDCGIVGIDKIADYMDIKKLLGQIRTGNNAWLGKYDAMSQRIYGRIIHNGAVTSRCTHSGPNLGQVPSPKAFMGEACRRLFTVKHMPNMVMVGTDAQGLELRNLSHFMYPFDRGAYAREVLDGDVHTSNQEAAGLGTRDLAKRFIYAFLYGCGDEALGAIIDPSHPSPSILGRTTKNKFYTKITAIKMLTDQVKMVARSRGYLYGLDGRRLYVHSPHVALNVLLQGAGAVLMKWATVYSCRKIREENLHARMVLHVHDEYNFISFKEHAERVGEICRDGIRKAGEHFKFNVRMDGASKIGLDWYEVH